MKLRDENLRMLVLKSTVSVVAIIAISRLFYLQVIQFTKYSNKAKTQQNRTMVIPSERGNIYFSDGSPGALSNFSYFAFAEPKSIDLKKADEIVGFLNKLNNINNISKEDLVGNSWYFPLVHFLTEEQKNEFEKVAGSSVHFEMEYQRFYPEINLLNSVIGQVAKNETGSSQGYFGIEGFYNLDLKGRDGVLLSEVDAFGNPFVIGNYSQIPALKGRSIVITVDRAVQYKIHNKLKKYLEEFGAKSASAIVVDPKSGAIISMVDLVKNDDKFEQDKEPKYQSPEISFGISKTYEPGSVMKVITMASGIDLGAVTPETSFMDDGPRYFSGYKVDTWDGKHYGLETMYGVLEHSNNIGASFVAEKVGRKNMWQYLVNFGFGKLANVDLEGEQTGSIRNWESWADIDLATVSFGQGMSATPLQVVMSFVAISNGGDLLKPYIADLIGFENSVGEVTTDVAQNNRVVVGRPISLATSNTMTDMITRSAKFGEAKYYISKKYSVSGKTGTAQIPFKGSYDPEKTNATFVGFLKESRRFVMIIKFEEPKKSIYASETAVPAWMDIAEDLASYYRIPEDGI